MGERLESGRSGAPGAMGSRELVRRLLRFLGVAAAGVMVTLAGLAWDATLHARDHSLAAREGVFTLTNPSHLMFLAGICLVAMGISGSLAVLASASRRMWMRPGTAADQTPVVPRAGRQARLGRVGARRM